MKPQELRIGNYVSTVDPNLIFVTCKDSDTRHDVEIVDELTTGQLVGVFNDGNFNSASYFMHREISELNPIPLTEEWLLELGLVHAYGKNDPEKNWFIAGMPVSINVFNGKGFKINYKGILLPIKVMYVHQLQNLYFALTGEELELDYKIRNHEKNDKSF